MPYYGTSGQFGGGMQNPQQQRAMTPWSQGWWENVDPTQAIMGAQNDIRRNMNANMNNAANRLGQGGMLGGSTSSRAGNSSVYQNALGGAATDASRQMADVANQYTYDAAKTKGNWGMQAQAQQQALMQDWWQRYYDAALKGGSPQWMQQWQQGGIPQSQQYAGSVNPWL